jgi:hypothetical protein
MRQQVFTMFFACVLRFGVCFHLFDRVRASHKPSANKLSIPPLQHPQSNQKGQTLATMTMMPTTGKRTVVYIRNEDLLRSDLLQEYSGDEDWKLVQIFDKKTRVLFTIKSQSTVAID